MNEEVKGRGLSTDVAVNIFNQNTEYFKALAGEELEFDLLRLYFGEDYKINDRIIIRQPTLQDVIDLGEKNFYAAIAPFTTNPTSFRVQLWDLGVDWNKVSDFELFSLLLKTVSVNQTSIFFGDVDFGTFDLVGLPNGDEKPTPILYSEKMDMEIDEETYLKIRKYFCFMFDVTLKNEFVKGRSFKEEIIAKERSDEAKRQAENKHSPLIQMVSFALNHPGFKYKKNELREVTYVEFLDSIKRLQIYEATRALTQGSYSGFCDTSKIPKENFNFMRSV